ncbi:MAG: VWA domain-containing protein [Desulfuromonadaceae bacterium]|nr:VWA domain-containing protein [Desulfuromonadaceae bacterium]
MIRLPAVPRINSPAMLLDFFLRLKNSKIPVTLMEFLTLLEALAQHLAFGSVEEFYYLSRLCLVKDEANYDAFDRVFAEHFHGISNPLEDVTGTIPEEWLRKLTEKFLSEEEKKQIQALGGLDKLLETLKKRLEEQKERHQGGSKWVGTGGTSPFGAYGYNPEGIRIGQAESRHHRAVKVWDKREFRDLDDSVELGTRNMKVALRRLRNFAREGALEELDMSGTIRATANNAGYLDIKMIPERHNKIKVLIFFDVGGSMDPHIELCEQLFSAARTEFKHLEYFYFHNCIYERVWRENQRRFNQHCATHDLLHQFGSDYKVIVVGDATMSPYELVWPGGSVEHHNPETGAVWLGRILDQFRKVVWLNPAPQPEWRYSESVQIVDQLLKGQMYPLNVGGIDQAISYLSK